MSKHIAIVGNPNCGKTTLFNKLTGSNQKVGNWAGVTVDKKVGHFSYQNIEYKLTDLPGIYSSTVVSEAALDEKIACEFILHESFDLVINIIDAANLKRNLYLTSQLLEMNVPCIVAVNMIDIAKSRNIQIDYNALSIELGCPVVPLVSSKNQGMEELQTAIADYQYSKPRDFSYHPAVETAIEILQQDFNQQKIDYPEKLHRFLATRLLEQDILIKKKINNPTIIMTAQQQNNNITKQIDEDSDILIADGRYQFVDTIYKSSVRKPSSKQKTTTHRIDAIVTNRWLGIPIFLFLMYLMFELSMNLGTLLQPLFDISSTTIFIDGVNYLGHIIGVPMWLTAIFAQGIGVGLNTVINFIPQIGLMFLFLSLLEDSGYMARAAFVMDRFMQFAGLPGKSFVPLILGFGCNVPGIMATRSLETKRDRILTCMMSPFMSCGARLAIFVVFASAFFNQHAGLVVFSLYLIGIAIALLTGILLKSSVLQGEASPFILELPVYHMPVAKNIFYLTWNRLKGFLFRAGKVIVPICLLVGTLNAIEPNGQVILNGSQNSILSNIGRSITPVLAPMGVKQDNWPATVGLITGTLAKEVVVGTLNTLYTQKNHSSSDDYKNFNLWQGLKNSVTATWAGLSQVFSSSMINPFTANEADHNMTTTAMHNMVTEFTSPIAAFAYLLFVLLYVPCISAIGAMAREIGNGWAIASTVWSFNIAYCMAVIFYQASLLLTQPLTASAWIIGLLSLQACIFLWLRRKANGPAENKFKLQSETPG